MTSEKRIASKTGSMIFYTEEKPRSSGPGGALTCTSPASAGPAWWGQRCAGRRSDLSLMLQDGFAGDAGVVSEEPLL